MKAVRLLPNQREANLIALAVHPEADTLAYISDALEIFEPGFRVATATSLAGAEAWIESVRPDLLLASVDAIHPDDLAQLVQGLALPRYRVILMGGRSGQLTGAAIAANRPTLSDLLKVVAAIVGVAAESRDDSEFDSDNVTAS